MREMSCLTEEVFTFSHHSLWARCWGRQLQAISERFLYRDPFFVSIKLTLRARVAQLV